MYIVKYGDLKPRFFVCPKCECEFIEDVSQYEVVDLGIRISVSCPYCDRDFYANFDAAPLIDFAFLKQQSNNNR